MNRIDGKKLAATIRDEIADEIKKSGLHPKLAVLLVGDNPASLLYVSMKEKVAAELGIATDIRRVPTETNDDELLAVIRGWNADESVDAILVQVPLPEGHDADAIIRVVDPRKDVDGFHPENVAAINAGSGTIFPPVHEGILRLVASTGMDMRGTKAAIIANSDTFAEPLEHLLSRAGCFVTVTKPESFDADAVRDAAIIVVAVGKEKFLTRDLITSGACVIDVGTNKLSNGKTVGDVDAENIQDIPGWLSPVPGGVGPMTIALLLRNTLDLSKRRRGMVA